MSIKFPEFVGRQEQLGKITRQIKRHNQTVVVNIAGAGGVGKTAILRQVQKSFAGTGNYLMSQIIDFSLTVHRVEAWILSQIVLVDPGAFKNYRREASELELLEPLPRLYREQEVQQTFVKEYNQLAQNHRVILLFDTMELVQGTPLLEYVITLVSQLSNTVLVLAGRENDAAPLLGRLDKLYGEQNVESFRLEGFSRAEAKLYFEQANTPHLKTINDNLLENIYLLSTGNAIKIALALEWLDKGIPLMTEVTRLQPEDLRSKSIPELKKLQEKFEYALMDGIRQLESPTDEAILFMAHLHKRFNRKILCFFFPDRTEQEINDLIRQLKQLPFVKYSSDDYFVLHDEMARLVQLHVWEKVEDVEERHQISQQACQYYEQEIKELSRSPEHRSEEDRILYWSYRVEQVYYRLDVDFQTGFYEFERLFEELDNDRRAGLAGLANKFLRGFEKKILSSKLLPCFLDGYYDGGVLLMQQQFNQAEEKLVAGLTRLKATLKETHGQLDNALDRHLSQQLYKVHHQLGFCYRSMGRWEKSIEHYTESLNMALEQADEIDRHPTPNPQLKQQLMAQIAETLNSSANVHRLVGEFQEARLLCQTSAYMRQGWDKNQVAKSQYVMAMILWEMGATAEAMRYLRQAELSCPPEDESTKALITKHRAYIFYRAGLPEEALSLLASVEPIFRQRGLFSELADTLNNFSRIYRRYARQGKDEELGKDSMALAEMYANEAFDIAKRIGDEFRQSECHLTRALNYYDLSLRDKERHAYYRDKALEEYYQGWQIAHNRYYRLLSVYSELRGNLAFEQPDYALAFDQYAQQCTLATHFKRAVYERAIDTVGERLRLLGSGDSLLALQYAQKLLDYWRDEAKLATQYPDLINEIIQIMETIQEKEIWDKLIRKYHQAFLKGRWEDAINHCDQILGVSGLYKDLNRANVLLDKIRATHRSGKLSEARRLAKVVLQIGEELNNPHLRGNANLWLARILWDATNTAESAIYMEEAHRIFNEAKDDIGLARTRQLQSYILHRTGFFQEPMDTLANAVQVFRANGMDSELAHSWNVMSRIARTNPDPKKRNSELAQEYADKALECALASNDSYRIAECYLSLAITALRERNYGKTLGYCQDGMAYLSQETHLLHSVYQGVRGSALLEEGFSAADPETRTVFWDKAFEAFVLELIEATKSKPARLVRAIDLIYEALLRMPTEALPIYTHRIVENWEQKSFNHEFPIVLNMCKEALRYRPFVQFSTES